MVRSIWVLAALLLGLGAFAAPAPKSLLSNWGDPVDPDKDCSISRGGNTLTIEMPGRDHDYDPIRKCFNAPRLMRDIEGEFEIQARVRIECRPSAQSTVKGQPSYVSAGFLLIYPDPYRSVCDRIEFGMFQQGVGLDDFAVKPLLASPQLKRERKGIGEDGYITAKSWFSKKEKNNDIWDREYLAQYHLLCDRGWTKWSFPAKTDTAYLKLKYLKGRERGGFDYSTSPDGEKWSSPGSHRGGMPTKLKLGLAAYSTSSEPSKVRFDQIRLTHGERENK